jgi:hypothetical protein
MDLISIVLNKVEDLIQITRNLQNLLKKSVKYSYFSPDFEGSELWNDI